MAIIFLANVEYLKIFPTSGLSTLGSDNWGFFEKLKAAGNEPDADLLAEMEKVRGTYDKELDAKHAAARGLVDAIIPPENVRDSMILALQTCLNTTTPHIGPFVLPSHLA